MVSEPINSQRSRKERDSGIPTAHTDCNPPDLEDKVLDSVPAEDTFQDSFDQKKIGLHKKTLELLEELKESLNVFSGIHSIFKDEGYKELISHKPFFNDTKHNHLNSVPYTFCIPDQDLADALNKYRKFRSGLEEPKKTMKDELIHIERNLTEISKHDKVFLGADSQKDASLDLISHCFRNLTFILGGVYSTLNKPNLDYRTVEDSDIPKNNGRIFNDFLLYQARLEVENKVFSNAFDNYKMDINQFTEIFDYLSKSNGSKCYVSDIVDETVESWKTESGDGRNIMVCHKDKQLELKTNKELIGRGIGYLLSLITKKPQNGVPIEISTYYNNNENLFITNYKKGYNVIHISYPKVLDDSFVPLLNGSIIPEITPSFETLSFLTKTVGVLGGATCFSTNGDTQAVDIYLPANGYNKAKTVTKTDPLTSSRN